MIIGYVFNTELYCPPCMGEVYTGEAVAAYYVEATLDAHARLHGINRADENTFDSSEFPKLIVSTDGMERCDKCREVLE